MASRPELKGIADELNIDISGMTTKEMEKEIREEIDKRFNINIKVGNVGLSENLLRFMSEEFDYIFKDKKGNLVNYKGEKI